jgi:hypothetical protein
MEGFGGPPQPSPTIAQCLNGGYGWLEVECRRCETSAGLSLDAIRGYTDLETGSGAEMSVVPGATLFTA